MQVAECRCCWASGKILVFHYRLGLSRCWAIRHLYGFKRRENGHICKCGSDHVSFWRVNVPSCHRLTMMHRWWLGFRLMGWQHSKSMQTDLPRLTCAHSHGSNLWELVRECHKALPVPEQLMSKGISDLLKHKPFLNWFCALGVDEIHLLYHWGLSFLVTLLQIEHVWARCPINVVTCVLSATVARIK